MFKQTKAATKSKGVRCTLLKDLFVTPTPRQSKNDNTDFKERKWMPRTPYPWFTPLLNPIFNLKKKQEPLCWFPCWAEKILIFFLLLFHGNKEDSLNSILLLFRNIESTITQNATWAATVAIWMRNWKIDENSRALGVEGRWDAEKRVFNLNLVWEIDQEKQHNINIHCS